MDRILRSRVGVVCLMVLGVAAMQTVAGDVNPPPGAVGDTFPTLGFKTLQQVEPRFPVQKLPTSGTAVHVISSPGSYYLTGNVSGVAGKSGIEITTNNVTLDLNGFALLGIAGSHSGVFITDPGGEAVRENIAVYNGTASEWGFSGLDLGHAFNCRVERVRVSSNLDAGIIVGFNSTVVDCHAAANGEQGIATGDTSVVRSCSAWLNGDVGIMVARQGVVENCTAENNESAGFWADFNASFSNCASQGNSLIEGAGHGFVVNSDAVFNNCTATGNTGDGIAGLDNLVIRGCSLSDNNGSGVNCFSDIHVTNTNASGNNFNGIWMTDGTVVDCTAMRNNGAGISNFDVGILNVIRTTSILNGNAGIIMEGGGRAEGCEVAHNGADGIFAKLRSHVLNNTCDANGGLLNGSGIHVLDGVCRIEGNACTNNAAAGIRIQSAGSLVIRNSCKANGNNWVIAIGNAVAPIVLATTNGVAISGDTYAGSLGSTDPNANYTH